MGSMKLRKEFRSQVPHVMLHLNPGVGRHGRLHTNKLEKLKSKAENTAEVKKQRYFEALEERRMKRDRLYRRLIKIDDETRRAVDRITNQRRKQAEFVEHFKGREDYDHSSKSKGPDQESKHYEMPESPTTAMNSERPWGEMDDSRRSSLRSTSIYDMEGTGYAGTSRPESPHATENPWKIDAKSTDHSGSSRRSSNASANPPEVMVTKVDKQPKKSTGSEAEGKRSVEEVMNLLPAPTPTRFIGRMHAIVSKEDKRRKSVSSVKDTIKETKDEDDERPGSKESVKLNMKAIGKFKHLAQNVDTADAVESSDSIDDSISAKNRRKKGMDGTISPATTSQVSSETTSKSSTGRKASAWGSMIGGKKKSGGSSVTPKTTPPVLGSGPLTPSSAKKRGSRGISKLTGSFTGTGNKGFEQAALFVGKFLKAKALKKSDDEILNDFGAEYEDYDDSEETSGGLTTKIIPFRERQGPKFAQKKGFGKMSSKSRKQKSFDSGPNTPMPMVPMPGGGDDADSSGGFSIHSLSKMANIQKASRVVVAAAIISNQMATLEELSKAWNQGLPTSISFLGKSCKVTPKGPGGLVVNSSPPPLGKMDPDFSNTQNMLSLLSKADLKIKTAAAAAQQESRPPSRGSGQAHMLTPGKGRSRAESRMGSTSSAEGSAALRVEEPLNSSQLESEDYTKKLVDALVQVRPASIPRWNEHKDVKEDKERDPCVFGPHGRNLAVDSKRTGKKPIESQNQPKSAKTSTVGGKEADSMATGTIVNLALKSFKGLKPPEGQK